MPARFRHCLAALALLALPAAALATDNAWPTTPQGSNLFGWNIAGNEGLDAVSDGAGGYFVAWDDGYTAHVQHVLANGRFAWPWYVFQLGLGGNGFGQPAIAPDGFGGVLVAWEAHGGSPSQELRVQRVTAAGALAPGWPAGGLPVAPSADYDYWCDVVGDGNGGAYVSFLRNGSQHPFVSHVTSAGTLDPGWPANGVEAQKNGVTWYRPQLFGDCQGGALLVYPQDAGGDVNLRLARVDRNGVLHSAEFGVDGLLVASGASPGFDAVQDLDGVVTVAWCDARTGSGEVYADALYAGGFTGFAPTGGLPLTSTPAVNESYPAVAADRNGNIVIAWLGGNALRGTRLDPGLAPHATFPFGGVVVATSPGAFVQSIAVDSDGDGGLLAGWYDAGSPTVLRAQRLLPDGAVAPGWAAGGETLATHPSGIRGGPMVFHDGDRGIEGVFDGYGLIATNRLRRDGNHGLLAPAVLTALNDVPSDQGGRLAIYWRASELDTLPSNPIGSYLLWRRMPAIPVQSLLARGARVIADGESPEAAGPGAIRVMSGAPVTAYWEYLGSTPARGWAGYGATVSTNSDLLGPAYPVPWEAYIVESVSPAGAVLATSAADSGFSLDNLSPGMPAAFTAVRAGGATHLHWARNAEGDFGSYRLHRGTGPAFVPDDGNLVSAQSDTGFADPALPGACYKLAAVDVHGNVSAYALVTPAQTLGVDDAAPAALAFAPVSPNPARGRVSLAYTLPQAGRVRLAVFDAQGRRVASLLDAPRDAGAHTEAWDLCNASGRALAPGLYLARLETPAGALSRRFVVVE